MSFFFWGKQAGRNNCISFLVLLNVEETFIYHAGLSFK